MVHDSVAFLYLNSGSSMIFSKDNKVVLAFNWRLLEYKNYSNVYENCGDGNECYVRMRLA